ncbi:MAG TPA: cysteine hydrolase family protein [Candidatus Acidoferrales bacterium]|nr:cysteine hydrolase family protein [Candidatus Acidoferrales bacterium]
MHKNTALLVIDVQLAMFQSSKKKPYLGDEFLARLSKLLHAARSVGVPVVYVQHSSKRGPFVPGKPGWAIHPEIAPHPGEPVVDKHTPDSFKNTELKSVLDELGVHRLIIAGMQTEYCVDTTTRSAFSHDYEVVLVGDGHSTFDTAQLPAESIVAHHNATLHAFARVATSKDILHELSELKLHSTGTH